MRLPWTHPRRARRPARTRPQVECLERRDVPSAARARPETANADREITVMTRNLYIGTDLDPLAAAAATGDPGQITAAASEAWQNVVESNFPERAEALADEIEETLPLLIGLQEVSLFRTGDFDSFSASPTPATDVQFDYLQILLDELASRGLSYEVVAVTQELDAEFPGVTAEGLQDIRLTDRDVILARADLPPSQLKLSNVQEENFSINVSFPVGTTGQTFTLLRGWNSVDATVRGQTFRFINTHLEVESADPVIIQVQVAQAQELLSGPANTDLPVILVGDFNSRADGTGTPTYDFLIGAGFTDVWSETHPDELGNTWGHDADLLNTTVNLTQRPDLVLFRGDLQAFGADVVGDELDDRTASGLWPSDHAGVVATLGLHVRPRHRPQQAGGPAHAELGYSGYIDSELVELLALETARTPRKKR